MPKEDNYLMKTLFPYLEFLHYSGLLFPPLWSSILSMPSEVSKTMMLDFGCCSKNAPWSIPPVSIEIAQHP
jgi:hypothetical protein